MYATLIFAVLALGAAVAIWYVMTRKKKETLVVLSPANFKAAKIALPPTPPPTRWGPSPVDATNVPFGEWDTNRNPSDFVTNANPNFPVPADSATIPDGLAWKNKQRFTPRMPDATFSTGFSDPTVGGEYQFGGVFGKAAAA